MIKLLLPSPFQLLQCRANVSLVYDRVSLEDAGSLPSCDAHDNFLRHAGSAQVPCRCPAEVMEEKARHLGGRAQVLPALAEVTDRLITSREQVILRALALHALAEQLEQSTRLDRDLTSFVVFGRARFQPDGASHEIDLTDAKIEQFPAAHLAVLMMYAFKLSNWWNKPENWKTDCDMASFIHASVKMNEQFGGWRNGIRDKMLKRFSTVSAVCDHVVSKTPAAPKAFEIEEEDEPSKGFDDDEVDKVLAEVRASFGHPPQ